MIKAEGLKKSYGKIEAVQGVDFEIGRGEVFGLLGPNGAGKSTTIGMLVGAIAPDSGRVDIDGKGSPDDPKVRRNIGLSPQSLALYEDLTAKENIEFFGQIYGLSKAKLKERVDWCLDFAGLADRANDQIKTYSGGMKRRINMAAALVHEPSIVLFDEPTVGVDPQSRNYIFESIEKLKKAGTTILYTTHYMEEAQRLCDRVAIIDQGKILAMGGVDALIDRFGGESVITADLIETPKPTIAGSIDGNTLRLNTKEPFTAIAFLSDQGLKFKTLRVDKPDLESVFLNLTGRSLRD